MSLSFGSIIDTMSLSSTQFLPTVLPEQIGGGMANETSTIIKKIVPYLTRLGYSLQDDLFFEETVKKDSRVKGFVDIEVRSKRKLQYLIEVKRDTQKINFQHRKQALDYGRGKKIPFVVVTNSLAFEILNVKTEKPISISGIRNALPPKQDVSLVLKALSSNPEAQDIVITSKYTVYTPGATLPELTAIFKRCHTAIRDIEKDDENAFSDFSKFLFLKLLEEKAATEEHVTGGFSLPYEQRFSDLKSLKPDVIKASIGSMFNAIQKDKKYGEVLAGDVFHIQNPKTYTKIVQELAEVSLGDSDVDVKGSAFEYFIKFNLKGAQLGQYFTPREVVRLMIELVDLKSIVLGLVDPSSRYTVVDPACGSGGFLIVGMQTLLDRAEKLHSDGEIDKKTLTRVKKRIKSEVFFGCDAKHMLVRTAKMNMIIAGDGFPNIKHTENSLEASTQVPFLQVSRSRISPLVDYVLTNPPFGMSESYLEEESMDLYDVKTTLSQALFLQKMIRITRPGGLICTVISEGILNTQTMSDLRAYLLKKCFVEAVIHLPYVTFQPSYARISTSILVLKRKKSDLQTQDYPIFMYDLKEIGYSGTGKPHGRASDEIIREAAEAFKSFKKEYG